MNFRLKDYRNTKNFLNNQNYIIGGELEYKARIIFYSKTYDINFFPLNFIMYIFKIYLLYIRKLKLKYEYIFIHLFSVFITFIFLISFSFTFNYLSGFYLFFVFILSIFVSFRFFSIYDGNNFLKIKVIGIRKARRIKHYKLFYLNTSKYLDNLVLNFKVNDNLLKKSLIKNKLITMFLNILIFGYIIIF